MIIPTVLIVPPAILAFIIYMWMYYEKDPENRLTDLRMLLAIACFGIIVGYLTVIVQGYDRTVPSMVCCAAAFGFLIWSIRMRRRQPHTSPMGRRQ
jgi:membrane associated rhomboid family serine protease